MKHKTARIFVAAAFLGSLLAAPALATANPNAKSNTITLIAKGLRSSDGTVRCRLYDSAEGYPTEGRLAVAHATSKIKGGKAVCRFTGIEPGTYAASYIHDEDNDKELDTNLFGVPSEGIGASNNARGTMGPPSFDDAAFRHAGVTTLRLTTDY